MTNSEEGFDAVSIASFFLLFSPLTCQVQVCLSRESLEPEREHQTFPLTFFSRTPRLLYSLPAVKSAQLNEEFRASTFILLYFIFFSVCGVIEEKLICEDFPETHLSLSCSHIQLEKTADVLFFFFEKLSTSSGYLVNKPWLSAHFTSGSGFWDVFGVLAIRVERKKLISFWSAISQLLILPPWLSSLSKTSLFGFTWAEWDSFGKLSIRAWFELLHIKVNIFTRHYAELK